MPSCSRNHVIERFERADVEPDPPRKRRQLTFVVIGGGLVGVELFGELDRLRGRDRALVQARQPRTRSGSSCSRGRPHHAGDRPDAGQLRDRGAQKAARGRHPDRGERAGPSSRASSTWRARRSRRIPIVLAAGIVPSPAGGRAARGRKTVVAASSSMGPCAPRATRRSGRSAIVRPSRHRNGRAYPSLAQHALREARVLAQNIAGVLDGRPPRSFCLHHPGNDGFAGALQGIRPASQDTVARLPRMGGPARFTTCFTCRPGADGCGIMIDWRLGALVSFPRPDVRQDDLDGDSLVRNKSRRGPIDPYAQPSAPVGI